MIDINKWVSLGISVLGKLAAFFFVFVFVESLEKQKEYSELLASQTDPELPNLDPSEETTTAHRLALVKRRDLFNENKLPVKEEKKPKKKSKLQLRLVGSLITPGKDPIALIENKASNKQGAFSLQEEIFDTGATLASVETTSVQVRRNGELETLEIEKTELPAGSDSEPIQAANGTFIVPEEEVSQALSNLPVLLSQARAIPFFRNGKSQGMRLYAIRAGSLYEKLGLKNSDIIKEINGTQVNDPTKALKLFEDLKSERSIQVNVERQGKDMNLKYEIR